MSFINYQQDFPPDNIDGTKLYRGMVTVNTDPLKIGRVRVRVSQFFPEEAIPGELCPWAIMRRPLGWGSSSNLSDFAIPNVGSFVYVQFMGGSIYSPIYETAPVDKGTKISNMDQNYPQRWGWQDPDASSLTVDTKDHTVDYLHQSGFEFHINADKSVHIIAPFDWFETISRDQTYNIGRDLTMTVGRNRDETIEGTDTETVTGDKTKTLLANEVINVTLNKTETIDGMLTQTVVGTITINATGAISITSAAAVNITGGGAVSIVGPSIALMPTAGPNSLKLGSSSPTDFMALLSALTKIATAFNGHTHTDPQGGTTGGPNRTMTFVSGQDYTTTSKAT